MYVCICNAVTDHQIRAAVDAGHHSLKALRATLGVAAECGRCARCASDLLKSCRGCGGCAEAGTTDARANLASGARSKHLPTAPNLGTPARAANTERISA